MWLRSAGHGRMGEGDVQMTKTWYYQGDVNLENGGTFYCLDEVRWGYAEAVSVMCCKEGGAQSNCWWISENVINMDCSTATIGNILKWAGVESENPTVLEKVIAMHEYGRYEQQTGVVVQIGPEDFDCRDPVTPDVKLRAGVDLEKWVRRKYKLGRKK